MDLTKSTKDELVKLIEKYKRLIKRYCLACMDLKRIPTGGIKDCGVNERCPLFEFRP